MIKEAIGTGETIDEAREAALTELCAGDNEDIQFDIISFPKKKVMGIFGGALAQVRAYVELPDPKPNKKQNKPEHKKPADHSKKEKSQPKKTSVKNETVESDKESVGVPCDQLNPESNAAKAVNYLKSVLSQLGCNELSFSVLELEDGAKITISGDDTGVIIGHRGETLDALQYLASLAATKKGSGYYRIVLNIGNYRQRREKALEGVAKKTAAQVLKTGRNRSLEPMNPYERRIIHTTIQGIEGVTSNSIGGGSSRRVVISLEEGYQKQVKSAPQKQPEKTVDAASTPLYGRIN